MKRWKSVVSGFVIVAATSGAIALMFNQGKVEETAKSNEPIWDARTVTASLSDYRPQINLIGQVEPVRDLTELAQVSAKVMTVNATDGKFVEKGELIVQLDDFNAQLQLKQTQADLADIASRQQLLASQHQLDLEALEVEQANLTLLLDRLKKQKAISNTQQAIDDLEQQIQRQRFAVLQREAAIANHPENKTQLNIAQQKLQLSLAAAQRQLDHTKISAPFAGRLAQLFVKEGQYATPGQPLFRLYSVDDMAVVVQLPARLLTEREQLDGMAHEQQRRSKVNFSHSEAQINVGQGGFKAWFQLDNAEQWLPGDLAHLTLNLAAKPESLKIPAASVFQDRWIYQVDAEQRLVAIEVAVLGSVNDGNLAQLVVKPHQATGTDFRLLQTRLNNPTTGMKIYEQGVDPEPVVVDTQNNDPDQDQVNQNQDDPDNSPENTDSTETEGALDADA